MKNELHHIDKIFLNSALDTATNISAKKAWKTMKVRLLISEIMDFNFVNVNWNYLIYTGILLLLLSFSFVYFTTDKSESLKIAEIHTASEIFPSKEINSSLINHDPVLSEDARTVDNQAHQTFTNDNSSLAIQNEQDISELKQQQEYNEIVKSVGVRGKDKSWFEVLPPRELNSDLSYQDEPATSVAQKFYEPFEIGEEDLSDPEKFENRPSYFQLGLNAGSVFILNNSSAVESIEQPVWFAGLNLRYNRPHFFIETAVELGYYESALSSTYRYDTILGDILSTGYDIVEVINEDGETVLERQYRSEITTIYDTLSSNDLVTINASSTVLYIPVNIGTRVFQYGNFYTSVFVGVTLKVLLVNNRSLPQYGSDYREIIEYEANSTINFDPEFYFQGGLLIGYTISNSISLEIKSSYNHILGSNSTIPENAKSNIKAGFGINYRF